MKEIKFRAWDKAHGMVSQPAFGNMGGGDTIILNELLAVPEQVKLMQYTSLKDKNDKEIYEGDIVLYPDTESEHVDVGVGVPYKVAEQPMNSFFPVQFVDGGFGFKVTYGEVLEHRWYWLAEVLFNEGLTLDIIGNIYENSDLLTN